MNNMMEKARDSFSVADGLHQNGDRSSFVGDISPLDEQYEAYKLSSTPLKGTSDVSLRKVATTSARLTA